MCQTVKQQANRRIPTAHRHQREVLPGDATWEREGGSTWQLYQAPSHLDHPTAGELDRIQMKRGCRGGRGEKIRQRRGSTKKSRSHWKPRSSWKSGQVGDGGSEQAARDDMWRSGGGKREGSGEYKRIARGFEKDVEEKSRIVKGNTGIAVGGVTARIVLGKEGWVISSRGNNQGMGELWITRGRELK